MGDKHINGQERGSARVKSRAKCTPPLKTCQHINSATTYDFRSPFREFFERFGFNAWGRLEVRGDRSSLWISYAAKSLSRTFANPSCGELASKR